MVSYRKTLRVKAVKERHKERHKERRKERYKERYNSGKKEEIRVFMLEHFWTASKRSGHLCQTDLSRSEGHVSGSRLSSSFEVLMLMSKQAGENTAGFKTSAV